MRRLLSWRTMRKTSRSLTSPRTSCGKRKSWRGLEGAQESLVMVSRRQQEYPALLKGCCIFVAAVSPGDEAKSEGKRKNIFDKGSALLFGMTSFTGVATRCKFVASCASFILTECAAAKRAAEEEESVYQPVADEDAQSFSSDDESAGDGLERLFAGAATFENVGQIQKGDTIGLIPWIVNHNVSVVQLVAHSDVTIHSIEIEDVLAVLRKDPILAIGFFKYVASVIGERADRDEVELCKQLLEGTAMAQGG